MCRCALCALVASAPAGQGRGGSEWIECVRVYVARCMRCVACCVQKVVCGPMLRVAFSHVTHDTAALLQASTDVLPLLPANSTSKRSARTRTRPRMRTPARSHARPHAHNHARRHAGTGARTHAHIRTQPRTQARMRTRCARTHAAGALRHISAFGAVPAAVGARAECAHCMVLEGPSGARAG